LSAWDIPVPPDTSSSVSNSQVTGKMEVITYLTVGFPTL
jgi:hypothetical protein